MASVLELDINDVPAFEEMDDDDWYEALDNWLNSHGFDLEYLEADEASLIPHDVFVVAAGPSPRGACGHAVVSKNGSIVHDPHPDGTGLTGPPTHYYLILPK